MKTLTLLALVSIVLTAEARADGLPVVGLEAQSLSGENVRYEALPYDDDTLLQRIEPRGAPAWQVLEGRLEIPVVAYDGSADGLSADGKTLILISPRPSFPRRETSFAVLAAQTLNLRRTITLRGDYSFDAISPRGRWMYVIHYTDPKDPLQYEVQALDLRTGRLNRAPIVDAREPGEKMNGHPLTRSSSADGRWAYTLYEGSEHPFVHALDTSGRLARCIDLDWLHGHTQLRKLRFAHHGSELTVRKPDGKVVAVVDTTTFEASEPQASGVGSWPRAGVSLLALVVVLGAVVYVTRARSRLAR
jgi:hypothetical protein